jgi:hypothetical protein
MFDPTLDRTRLPRRREVGWRRPSRVAVRGDAFR